MANDRGTTPHNAQKNGQSAISQDAPLRELRQDGDADGGTRPARKPTRGTSELTNGEVSALCDIGRDGKVKMADQCLLQSLVARGFVTLSEEPLADLKLTFLGQQTLSKRGVGLNES